MPFAVRSIGIQRRDVPQIIDLEGLDTKDSWLAEFICSDLANFIERAWPTDSLVAMVFLGMVCRVCLLSSATLQLSYSQLLNCNQT